MKKLALVVAVFTLSACAVAKPAESPSAAPAPASSAPATPSGAGAAAPTMAEPGAASTGATTEPPAAPAPPPTAAPSGGMPSSTKPTAPAAGGGGTKPLTIGAAQASFDDARKSFIAAADCPHMCKALSSMENATTHLCELSQGPEQKRCTDAKAKLAAADAKVKSTCGGCTP